MTPTIWTIDGNRYRYYCIADEARDIDAHVVYSGGHRVAVCDTREQALSAATRHARQSCGK